MRGRQRQRAASGLASPASHHLTTPHLCLLRAPSVATPTQPSGRDITVATYNVHRWTGLNGRGPSDPARAAFVISELKADVIALQEVMRPHRGDDPLVTLADAMGLHVAFAATRVHKRGEIGNAILSRWPIAGVSMLDLSFSRIERRVAVSARLRFEKRCPRHRHDPPLPRRPHAAPPGARAARPSGSPDGAHVAAGRHERVAAVQGHQALDDELRDHHNLEWPASFPSAAPVFSLDRVYARGVRVLETLRPPHPRRPARLRSPPRARACPPPRLIAVEPRQARSARSEVPSGGVSPWGR